MCTLRFCRTHSKANLHRVSVGKLCESATNMPRSLIKNLNQAWDLVGDNKQDVSP